MVQAGNRVFFSATAPGVGEELWMSDGTEAGTVLVKDVQAGAASSFPTAMIDSNGLVFFEADDGVAGREVWRSDGTAAGTMMVKDIGPGAASYRTSSIPLNFTSGNGMVFFLADDGVHGRELWRSDGTSTGTILTKDIEPGSGPGARDPLCQHA